MEKASHRASGAVVTPDLIRRSWHTRPLPQDGLFLPIIIAHYKMNALLFLRRQAAVCLEQPGLVPVEIPLLHRFDDMVDFRMPNEEVYGGVENLCKGNEGYECPVQCCGFHTY